MKVVVNADMCEGHGKCAMAAPDVFEVGEDEISVVKIEDVPESMKPAVDRAIRLCPRQAIAWAE